LTAMTCIFFLAFLQFQRWSLVVVNQSENEEKKIIHEILVLHENSSS
jgi:hypothetical protein